MTKVLVADDDPNLLAVCVEVLEFEGYDVQIAMDGGQALDRLYSGGIDIALLDVMMPIMDGVAVCEKIKADGPGLHNLRIVLMSASETFRRVGTRCADAVLEKPFDIDLLVSTIDELVGSSAGAGE